MTDEKTEGQDLPPLAPEGKIPDVAYAGQAVAQIREQEMVPYLYSLWCADCNVQMPANGQHVVNPNDGKPYIVHVCPKCNKGAQSDVRFPSIQHKPKSRVVVPTANFKNGNRGPQGRH